MDDRVAHVYRRPVHFKRSLDYLYRAIHARAKTPRFGNYYTHK
jgi:hypothetical protein